MTPRASPIKRATYPIALAAAAIAIAGLVALPAIGIGSAEAPRASVDAGSMTSSSAWAYGNVTTLPVQGSDLRGTYSGSATYGFVAITSQTNSSASVTEITLEETIGISLTLSYCRPSCTASPRQVSQFSYRASETEDAWTNITDAANVSRINSKGPGPNETAIGILDSATITRASIVESDSDTDRTTGSPTREQSVSASYEYAANSSVSFAPALGVLPTSTISAGDAWTSASSTTPTSYEGGTGWSAQWAINVTQANGSSEMFQSWAGVPYALTTGPVALVGSVPANGAVTIRATPLINISYSSDASFTVGPGLAVGWASGWLPAGALGSGLSSTSSWAGQSVVTGSAAVNSIYARPTPGLTNPVESSAFTFAGAFRDPKNGGVNDTTPATTVVGDPMTKGNAESTASCLLSADICSGPATSSTTSTLVVAGAVIVLGAVIAMVVVTRQRRIPPPGYPNAALYPPGQTVRPEPEGGVEPDTPRRPPAGPSDDPLDQLW